MNEEHTTVNRLELASELADLKLMDLQNYAMACNPQKLPFPNGIVKEDENNDVIYTEEAQEKFNELYDYYERLILKCKI